MRFCLLMAFASALVTVLCADAVIGCQPTAGKAEEQTKTIPLDTCYATEGVTGCKQIKRGGDEPHAFDLEDLISEHRAGPSNVILVRGKEIADAVKATRWAFTAGVRADSPILPNPSDTKAAVGLPLWLVAHFGAGPSTPDFGRVHSVDVRQRSIRVNYSRIRANKATKDIVHYYFWVPLGKVDTGAYTLELFDAARSEVTLMRQVVVPSQ